MRSTELARSVVRSLVEAGVREIVVAPGSRNAPLSFAALDAAEAGLVRLHTRIDERSAGFLAVGLTRNGSRAAVICTSGTAVANLHPAAMESAHAGLDTVFVTADRPRRLHGTTANQTTDQAHVLGGAVRFVELEAPAAVPELGTAGPLHLNVLLDEPLMPPTPSSTSSSTSSAESSVASTWVSEIVPGAAPRWADPDVVTELPLGPRTVVVAGDDSRQAARRLAEAAGWPLLAEPTSGSRTGDLALRCYRLLIEGELGQQIERVVVFGRATLTRPMSRLLERPGVEVLSVLPPGVSVARPYPCTPIEAAGVAGPDDPAWLAAWLEADRAMSRLVDRTLAAQPDLTPYAVARAVSDAVPPGGLLVVGASSTIRDLDLMMAPTPVGSRRKVIANRGLSGIDGTVSTAIGGALARPEGARNLALMGDVTFMHDSNGLVLGPDEPRPDLTIVVVNDDGGSIFAVLEQGAPAHAAGFERLFATPHHVDLGALCAATRTPHLRVTSLPELEQALASPNGGIEVVEVVVRRDNRRALDEALRALRLDPG